jgi:UDP-N-acetylmuramoyl-tripeptide--D-alanyl-D-alanine ligase
VLNYDDKTVRKTAEKCVGRIFWYGLKCTEGAIAVEEEKVMEKDGVLGLYFKMLYGGSAIPVFVKGVAAKHEIYSLLAGASAGMLYELTPLEVAHGLEQYKPEHGRFVLQKGIHKTILIDDTYNASLISVTSALKSLKELPVGKRRIAVLGDMLELGNKEEDAHRSIGEAVATLDIDALITYGKRAFLMSERAKELGMSTQKIRHFDAMEKLIEYVKSILKEGDAVLVKGSRGMKMERVAAALHLREK